MKICFWQDLNSGPSEYGSVKNQICWCNSKKWFFNHKLESQQQKIEIYISYFERPEFKSYNLNFSRKINE